MHASMTERESRAELSSRVTGRRPVCSCINLHVSKGCMNGRAMLVIYETIETVISVFA